MFRCVNCKSLFEDADISREYHGLDYGFESLIKCPCCGSDEVEEARKCELCGEYHSNDGDYCDTCEEMLQDYTNYVVDEISKLGFEKEKVTDAIKWILE